MFSNNLKGQLISASLIAIAFVAALIAFALNGYTIVAIIIAVILAAAVVALNIWFERNINKPISDLTKSAKRIADGSYGTQAVKYADDEIGKLTDEINEMSSKIALSDKATTEFISQISHELRTPLTAITGWSETIQYDAAVQGDSLRGAKIISKEAERLTSMVSDLLEFTRIQDGRFNLRIELIDIAAELEDSLFNYGNLMRQAGIDINYIAPNYDIALIPGDSERLKQVFLNLLDNAANHGGDGKIVDVSLKTEADHVIISIRDHGKGIPEADLPYVKEKFFKGSTKNRGSGIGLAVCNEIIARHNGELIISNAEGGGCIATIILPITNN